MSHSFLASRVGVWVGLILGYAVIALVIYSPSLKGPRQYDDDAQILDEQW